jgi:hypothetical protein
VVGWSLAEWVRGIQDIADQRFSALKPAPAVVCNS